ncbi:MAG: capsular exopolysaccharide family [Anaerocolumna sp.]|jgi:receptor protein-tyrosine kinase|nr:capsular exopolysaccharide family [Anaerocolumna sp.]
MVIQRINSRLLLIVLGVLMNNYDREIEGEREDTIDLSTLVQNIWKGTKKFWWLVVVLSVLSAGITYFRVNRGFFPYYTASATFTVSLSNDSGSGSIYDDNLKAAQMSKTFPYIMTSGVLKNVIAADLGVASVPESITAENIEETNLFTIKVTSSDAKKAYDVLQSAIVNYPKIAETVVGRTRLDMLDETGVPQEPFNQPNYRNSIKVGAIAGAMAGIFLILFYAFTRKTIHKAKDLTELFSMKHLGTLPEVKFKKRGRKFNQTVSLQNDKISPWYRESMYKIRTRVEKAASNDKCKSILVTSAIQGEGKSTFAFNLALAMAEGGKKVVLVDCDLRHPSIQNMITLQVGAIGLEEVLNEEVELKDAIKYYDHVKLSILAGTKPTQNVSEIIGMPKMWDIITELEKQADYIILDTAPSAILSDTSNLAKFADGVIFVVKQDYAKVNQILEGLEHISESSSIEIIGCVLNHVKSGIGRYGYGYGNYGRYGGYRYQRKKSSIEI